MDTSVSSTSASLINRVRENNPAAWGRLTGLYGPIVYQWARRAGLQSNDSADVLQEVFQSVAVSIAKFHIEESGDTFRGWLWAITKNKITDHFRQQAKRPEAFGGSAAHDLLQSVPANQPDVPPAEANADANEAHKTLLNSLPRRAVEMLKDEFKATTWEAFCRVAIHGDRPADVAEDLGISVAAVYMAKSRVFRRVRQELDNLID